VTSLIVSQAILNVFAVLGLAPLTGVPLPFVSYGSSSLIVMLASMGLLMNVASGGTAHVRALAPAGKRGRPTQRTQSRATPARATATRAGLGRGGSADAREREPARWGREQRKQQQSAEDRDRRGGDRRARGAGARGGRRAAG
jgi:hypothetical protein